jgi:hypothetical protein
MTNLTHAQKKEMIIKIIFERSYELIQQAEELRGILFPKNASHKEIEQAALKKAFKEWNNNEPVFSIPTE